MKRLLLTIAITFCLAASCGAVDTYTVKILERYPHDTDSYTQGLFFNEGCLYETTGLYGESTIRRVDLKSGRAGRKLSFSRKYFGEGSCAVDGKMYILTWTNKVAFVYDIATLKYEKTLSYPREGWGLASIPVAERAKHKGAVMVASDGSSRLYFLDKNLNTVKTVQVNVNGHPVRLLNELEWVDGNVWANVYTTDMLVVIDPSDGNVCARIDCSPLIPKDERTRDMDVLNGIAIRPDANGGNEIFLTGKKWPWMFRVRLVPLK